MNPLDDEPLLLHSLSLFEALIVRCLEAAGARRVVEIGSETGALTLPLAEWAAAHDAVVVSVDPEPPQRVREAAERLPIEVVAGPSPDVLADIERGDAYVIDGDHNYHSVFAELQHVYGGDGPAAEAPLAILHDIGWPCARRDMYYAPDRLPAGAVHEHSYRGGVLPGVEELVPGGFRGGGNFAWALKEGGPRNGILTAVEDMLAEREDLQHVVLPAVFGVGIVWSREAPYADRLGDALAPLDQDAVLATMERNRLALYLHVLALQDALSADRLRADRVIAGLHAQISQAEADNAALRLEAAGG